MNGFDWPVENCDGCGNRVTKCTCGKRSWAKYYSEAAA